MALKVDVRDVTGSTTGSVSLDETLFGIQPNVPVMHQVVTAQLAAARAGTQSTKTRAEVAGGGKKPFKQKGTGRARQGSERAPHFAGGGVALGPKPRSYRQKTPRKMIQLALRSALSDRAADGKVVVVGSWPWEAPSTKDAKSALAALGLDGKVLLVLSRSDEEAYKSFRNLPGVQMVLDAELNAYDILCNDWIVFTSETLPGGGSAEASTGSAGASASGGQKRPTETVGEPAPAASSAAADEPGSETAEEEAE
ncbi:MAG TPA: 50S ribosomal protein L4 [Acidimicrobiales bacterium]|nr:50S ribosomal protein L4 [Acidimicrobiales bacterium]